MGLLFISCGRRDYKQGKSSCVPQVVVCRFRVAAADRLAGYGLDLAYSATLQM